MGRIVQLVAKLPRSRVSLDDLRRAVTLRSGQRCAKGDQQRDFLLGPERGSGTGCEPAQSLVDVCERLDVCGPGESALTRFSPIAGCLDGHVGGGVVKSYQLGLRFGGLSEL